MSNTIDFQERRFKKALEDIFEACKRLEKDREENMEPTNVLDLSERLLSKRLQKLPAEMIQELYNSYFELGKAFDERRYDDLIETAKIFLDHEDVIPPDLGIYFRLAWALYKTNNYTETRKVCEKAASTFTTQSLFYVIQGNTFYHGSTLEDFEQAKVCYNLAIKSAQAENNLGTVAKAKFDLMCLETKIEALTSLK